MCLSVCVMIVIWTNILPSGVYVNSAQVKAVISLVAFYLCSSNREKLFVEKKDQPIINQHLGFIKS